MMDPNPTDQNLLDLRACPLAQGNPLDPLGDQRLALFIDQPPTFEQLGDLPALVTIETENQSRSPTSNLVSFGDLFELLVQVQIFYPFELQRYFALGALNQFQVPAVRTVEP